LKKKRERGGRKVKSKVRERERERFEKRDVSSESE
jgi:hypothetical protein